MRAKYAYFGFWLLVLLAATVRAAESQGLTDEWPQWLGPDRNGISPSRVSVADDWDKTPLKQLWSQPVPSDMDGGLGSLAVAGGRTLVYLNLKGKAAKTNESSAAKPPETATDAVLCFDARTGAKQWEAKFPGVYVQWECSSTPAIAGELCYVQGSGHLYCLDLQTGKTVWLAETGVKKSSSSPLVKNGRVYVISGALLCFEAHTGKLLWRQEEVEHNHSSPAFWEQGGKTYVVCNSGNNDLVCVQADDGAVLWQTTPGGHNSTPIIDGDIVVVQAHPEAPPGVTWTREVGSLVAYKLGVDKAVKLWEVDHKDRGSGPVIDAGYVYAIGGGHGGATEAVKIKLDTGALIYRKKASKTQTECSNPVLLSGKILFYGNYGETLCMLRPELDTFDVLTSQKVYGAHCTSPAVAYGRVYLRGVSAVSCWELPVRKP